MPEKDTGDTETENPWKTDEAPWRLEDEGKKDTEESESGRFEPDEVPEEPEKNRRDNKSKIGVVAVFGVIAVVVAGMGAAVVADGGSTDTPGAVTDDTPQDGSVGGAGADADGIVALPFEAGATGGDQRLRLMNAGEELDVSELRLDVSLPEYGTNATVTDLPTERLTGDENIEGDDIFDRSYGGVGGAATEETWQGDELFLRVKHSGDGAEMSPGEVVRVVVTHRQTDDVVFSDTVEAE